MWVENTVDTTAYSQMLSLDDKGQTCRLSSDVSLVLYQLIFPLNTVRVSFVLQRCPTFGPLWATLEEEELFWATH